ncbi:hypothetical protein [Mucilaginibacter antarcticus]|uniref:ATP-dependent DNA ligase n=1 Tax=Mucilaginibacter antarcticus TaxID=1855725 RepID=UPI00362ADDD6
MFRVCREDIRSKSQSERRTLLESVQAKTEYPEIFRISALIDFKSWDDLAIVREQSRAMIAEGIMLKRKSATYQVGRKRGDWWKWKIDPLSVDAVMIYAQRATVGAPTYIPITPLPFGMATNWCPLPKPIRALPMRRSIR